MHVLLAVLGIAALLLGALWLHARSNRRLVEGRFADREPLSADQFGRKFFSTTQAPIAAKLRGLLADELGLDLARLRPEDEPVRHLRIEEFDSLAVAEVVMASEKAFNLKLRDEHLVRIPRFCEPVALAERYRKTGERTD